MLHVPRDSPPGATPADLLAASMAAEPSLPHTCKALRTAILLVRTCSENQRGTETVDPDRVGRFVAVFVHRETVTMWRHWRRISQRLDQVHTPWGFQRDHLVNNIP